MDTSDEPEEPTPPVHCSTGRLTRVQAETVNRWRARLMQDRPLPGQRRAGEALRLLGIDDRPRASCSDAIAAAVAELLAEDPPDEAAVMRYTVATRLAQKLNSDGGADAPRWPPVSFYLAGELADAAASLRERAWSWCVQVHDQLHAEAAEKFPSPAQAPERREWVRRQLTELGVPERLYRVPAGTLARMAIDRWRRRAVDRVAAAAVKYAEDAHEQPHRARRDMHHLRR
jgi:hypothetical protein